MTSELDHYIHNAGIGLVPYLFDHNTCLPSPEHSEDQHGAVMPRAIEEKVIGTTFKCQTKANLPSLYSGFTGQRN